MTHTCTCTSSINACKLAHFPRDRPVHRTLFQPIPSLISYAGSPGGENYYLRHKSSQMARLIPLKVASSFMCACTSLAITPHCKIAALLAGDNATHCRLRQCHISKIPIIAFTSYLYCTHSGRWVVPCTVCNLRTKGFDMYTPRMHKKNLPKYCPQ